MDVLLIARDGSEEIKRAVNPNGDTIRTGPLSYFGLGRTYFRTNETENRAGELLTVFRESLA